MVTVMFSDLDSSPGLCLILHNIVCFLFIRKKMLTWYFREEKFTDVTDWLRLDSASKYAEDGEWYSSWVCLLIWKTKSVTNLLFTHH